jgi:tetratricopeptide (TPR) repeat protein
MDGDEVQVPDRREAIEAAFEAAESSATDTSIVQPATPAEQAAAPAQPAEGAAAPTGEPTKAPAPVEGEQQAAEQHAEQQYPVDKPPQAWRAAQKAKWDKLDPDVRQEVMRRERETTRVLGETAQARQFTQQFQQAVAPYVARLHAINPNPIEAVNALLRADYQLATAPKVQRARMMAGFIKDYDVDIVELDNALAGATQAVDPVQDKVDQLLQQRLAPFQQYLEGQRQLAAQQEQQADQQISESIAAMASDPKYPHFAAVRGDMADLVDVAAKRGQYLTLEQAYDRAIVMNPEVSKLVATQRESQARGTAAQAAHARAQQALGASVSVGGAPSSVPSGVPAGSDRRAVIEAAFDSVGGR